MNGVFGMKNLKLVKGLNLESKILSIIPARGGSKGLPRKNIIDLAGKPLISWTIDASLTSKHITKTIVSSEDDEILKISQQYGADIIKRPTELAHDSSNSEDVIKHVLEEFTKANTIFDYIVLLQPTSPLRSADNIDSAFEIIFNTNATAIISVCEIDNKVLKAFLKTNVGYLKGISNNSFPFMRRQDLPKVLLPNGAIYIISTSEFLQNNKLFTDKTLPYQMSKNESVDIDSIEDIYKIESFLNHHTI